MQLPRLADYNDAPRYNTLAVVRLTQVKAARLRIWERRYAILAPHRSDNQYRLYSERDLAVIRWLRDQVASGMTISQAIAALRAGDDHAPSAAAPVRLSLDDLAHQLAEAALHLDELEAVAVLRLAFAVQSVEDVCLQVITPALQAIGDYWAVAGQGIMQEHFLSGIVRANLAAVWQASNVPPEGPQVLVGCVGGEQHELGALVLALFLRRSGLCVSYLGANLDDRALISLAEELRPAAVCLSVTMSQHVAPARALISRIARLPGLQIFLGGQAAWPDDLRALDGHITISGSDSLGAVAQLKRMLLPI